MKGRKNPVSLADLLVTRRALTVPEVARVFNVSTRHIYNMVAADRLPCVRLARCIRFDPLVLAAFMRGGGLK